METCLWVSDQDLNMLYNHRKWLETWIFDLESKGIVLGNCTTCVAKPKSQISCFVNYSADLQLYFSYTQKGFLMLQKYEYTRDDQTLRGLSS